MRVQDDVPFSTDELTTEWLSESLRDSGVLKKGEITDLVLRPLGDQVGFNGEVVIVSPTYSGVSDEDLPSSMVLKIPTASRNRILGQTMGLYEKEIRFYRDLQPQLSIRTPKHYCSALDEADDSDVILERLEGMNKLPIFMIRGIMAMANWFVSGHPRRYALFIEDLSGFRMGDQTSGCGDEDLRKIVSTMATLHAQFSDREDLAQLTWIAPYSVTSRIMQMRYLGSVNRYIEDAVSLTQNQLDMLDWLKKNGVELTERFGALPATLLHGDFRLDNICFDDDNNEMILFDWQTMQIGPGASDLAYFISATMPADSSEAQVDDLLDCYQQELQAQGVLIERSELRHQYEIGMLLMLHRILPTIYESTMDLDEGRGLPLLRAWLDRVLTRLLNVDHRSMLLK